MYKTHFDGKGDEMPKGKRMTLVEKAYGSVKTAVSDCIIQSQASITYDRRNDRMHVEAKGFLFTLPKEGLLEATITLVGSGKTYPAVGYFLAGRRARKALTYDEQAAWYALTEFRRFEKEEEGEESGGRKRK